MFQIDTQNRFEREYRTVTSLAVKRSSTHTSLSLVPRRQAVRSWAVKKALTEIRPGVPPTPFRGRWATPLPQFGADENVRDGLVRLSGELIRNALARIESSGSNRANDLHQVRVTAKRLRASLRLVRPVIGNAFFRQENRRLKKVADCLALFRDATVFRQTLVGLSASLSTRQDKKAFASVLRRLDGRGPAAGQFRIQRETAMNEAARDLLETGDSFQNMLIAAEEWEAIGPGLHDVYGKARRRMLRAIERDTEHGFHNWRKQVKYLCYQLQMVQRAWPGRLGTMVKQLNRLQDTLGKVHDLAVLGNLLVKSPQQYGGRQAVKRVAARLERKCGRLREQSEALGKEIFRDKPGKFLAKLNRRWTAWRGDGEFRE